MPTPGYTSRTGTQELPTFLATAIDYTVRTVTIDSSARDSGNSTTTDLRQGCILVQDSSLSGSRYTLLSTVTSPNTGDLRSAVVLWENIYSISGGHTVAQALWTGDVHLNRLYYNGQGTTPLTAAQKDSIQRLMLR